MYLVAIAWMYVVLMMSIVEALSPQGTVLGALLTFALYGLLPMGISTSSPCSWAPRPKDCRF